MRRRLRADIGSIPLRHPSVTLRAVDADLLRIARWLERQPWNSPDTDKAWVLKAIWTAYEFQREVRLAERVGSS